MTPANDVLDPNVEEDLTSAGFQRSRATFQIVATAQGPTKKGDGTIRTVSFRSVDAVNGIQPFEVADRINVANPNPKAVAMGQGTLKQLYTAAFGKPQGAFNRLQGQFVSAEVWEDDNGFRRIGRYRPVETTAASQPAAKVAAL